VDVTSATPACDAGIPFTAGFRKASQGDRSKAQGFVAVRAQRCLKQLSEFFPEQYRVNILAGQNLTGTDWLEPGFQGVESIQ
jgi:hypothetical protein